MNTIKLTKEKPRKHVEIAPLSKEEKTLITEAVRVVNTRRPSFYKTAILTYAQSVLSSSSLNKTQNEASSVRESSRVGGASFLSREEENGREWK